MSSYGVIGGGYGGIIASILLREYSDKVSVFDNSEFLGGVLNSSKWKEYYIDNGCHLFDNTDKSSTKVALDILQENYFGIDVNYFSVTNGSISNDISIPDFSSLSEEKQKNILFELLKINAIDKNIKNNSLSEAFENKYGCIASGYLKSFAEKMYALSSEDLESSTIRNSLFNRIRLVPDNLGRVLKESKTLDEHLAISSCNNSFQFYENPDFDIGYRNFYPSNKGMKGFCIAAHEKLCALGVDINLSSNITSISPGGELLLSSGHRYKFDKLFWTLDIGILSNIIFSENPLSEFIHKTPMILFYFEVNVNEISEFTYGHIFDSSRYIFRASAMGKYSKQINEDGRTFICVEVPTKIGSEIWNKPEDFLSIIWQELRDLNLCFCNKPQDYLIRKTPVSYVSPKLGYSEEYDKLRRKIESYSSKIVIPSRGSFSKVDITKSIKKCLNDIGYGIYEYE